MSTTLTYNATTVNLPDDLLWADEHDWSAVEQRQQYGLTGSLIIDSAGKQSGRTIHLQAGDDFAWMSRSTLNTLRTWANVSGAQFTLSYRGVAHTVKFDHAAGAIDAAPVWECPDPIDADPYAVSLRFLKV